MTDENGEPLSEEVISWILATLPVGAMVGLNKEYGWVKYALVGLNMGVAIKTESHLEW